MGKALTGEFSISAEWERLDEGTPEEKACFGGLTIRCGDGVLSECLDGYVNRVRPAPLLSAYHLAEWLAWNWWRLRWEPRSRAPDWGLAHRMATVGEGYVWPNITIFTDGERTALVARSTQERRGTAIRYVSDVAAVVTCDEFESAIDGFIAAVLGQLRFSRIPDSNLDRVWGDVSRERNDREVARRRKIEALMGLDPEHADAPTIERLLADAALLGERSMNEVAADHGQGGPVITRDELEGQAHRFGFDSSPRQTIRLDAVDKLPRSGDVPAWRAGAAAASLLRRQVCSGAEPVLDSRLAELAGVSVRALTDTAVGASMSYALDRSADHGRVVLRSKWSTGRRFDLARLIGDRIVAAGSDRLYPATRAYTYRQKLQRAFAAEFLSPFESVDGMLGGDYSPEKQLDVANHFQVSELTVRTLLVNHRRLDRDELDGEVEAAVA